MTSPNTVLAWFVFLCVLTSAMTQEEKVRMCYFTNWAQYRHGVGRFLPRHLDPFLCTHILYAFAHIDTENNTVKFTDDNDVQSYTQILSLKESNPRLKVLLAVGGSSHGTRAFEEMATSPARAQVFAANVQAFLRTHGFDGMDVDWEFPTELTRDLFYLFIQKVGLSFMVEGVQSGQEKLELTIAVSGDPATVDTVYQPAKLLHFVDYILLMTYDLWGTWSLTLGHHSPLHPVLPFHEEQGRYSVSRVVEAWVSAGMPRENLVPGLSTYGRTGVMSSPSLHQPGNSWARHMGTAGPITMLIGFLSYFEICENLKSGQWEVGYSSAGQVPYAWNPTALQYLCYDNAQSFQKKAEYIAQQGLGGAMFWTLDYDDFTGQACQEGTYPLIRKVKAVFTGKPDNADSAADINPAPPVLINNNNNNNNNNDINAPAPPTAAPKPPTTTTTTTPATTITKDEVHEDELRLLPSQSNMAAAISGLTVCVWVVGTFCFYKLIQRCCSDCSKTRNGRGMKEF